MEFLITIILCGLVILLSFIFYKRKLNKILNKRNDEIYHKEKEKIVVQVQRDLAVSYEKLDRLNKEINEKTSFNNSLLKMREEELDRLIEEKKKEKIRVLEQELANFVENINTQKLQTHEQLQAIIDDLEDYRKKREVINEDILRSRAVEEKQDFYKIRLDEKSLTDIEILESIRPKLSKVDLLSKLIYDNYISKPVKEMTKRVLGGKDPSGIYKITNILTQEVYVGKSTTVAGRWTNHVKAAAGLEGVADSMFQRALKKYGITNFTWELLEEVPKDKLTSREKYWIEFFDTTHVGYNQRIG